MRRIDDGSSPLFMADGKHLVYLRENKIWLAEVGSFESGSAAVPDQLVEGRGSFGSLRLSPDGRRLAFVSGRGSHSFIGVYDFTVDRLRYPDPGVDRDISPVWSPDGRGSLSFAFLREWERLGCFYARARGLAVVDPGRGCRRGRRCDRSLARRSRPGQRVPCSRLGFAALLDERRPPHLSLGARRLDSSLFDPEWWRRPSSADAGLVGGRGGVDVSGSGGPLCFRPIRVTSIGAICGVWPRPTRSRLR